MYAIPSVKSVVGGICYRHWLPSELLQQCFVVRYRSSSSRHIHRKKHFRIEQQCKCNEVMNITLKLTNNASLMSHILWWQQRVKLVYENVTKRLKSTTSDQTGSKQNKTNVTATPLSIFFLKGSKNRQDQRRVSHFHFYENLVAANLGMRFALWHLRAATRNS